MTRSPKLLIVVVAAVLAAAYWFALLAPKRQEAADIASQVAKKQQEVAQAQATLATYRKSRDTYKVNYSTAVRLGKAVPVDDDVRSLMVQLDAAAGSTGVDFRSLSVVGGAGSAPAPAAPVAGAPAAPVAPPGAVSVGSAGFAALPFSFNFEGSFFDLSSLFTQLERFVTIDGDTINVKGRLMRVESISLAPDTTGFPHIRAVINASSYLVPQTQGLTAGATAASPGTVPAATTGGATPPATHSIVTSNGAFG